MISITLPSIKPEILVTALENLDASTKGLFEVIVVSPYAPRVPLSHGKLVWIEEKEQRGVAAGHEAAFAAAEGEFVFAWADDHIIEGAWDDHVLYEFEDRETECQGPLSLGMRSPEPHNSVNTIFGRFYPCFPFMRRLDVSLVGGWLSGAYRAGFSDSDLGLRVWGMGGRCEWTRVRPIRPTTQPWKYVPGFEDWLRADVRRLLDAHRELAGGWGFTAPEFNVGVEPERHLALVEGYTVCEPDAYEFWRKRRHADALQHLQPQ